MIAVNKGIHFVGFSAGYHHRERYGYESDGFYTLYDNIIPKILDRMSSKFNCGIDWKTIKSKSSMIRLVNGRSAGWYIEENHQTICRKPIQNKAVALSFLKNSSKSSLDRVKTIKLSTLFIKQVSEKGLPLFGW